MVWYGALMTPIIIMAIIYGLWHHKLWQKHPNVLKPPKCILLALSNFAGFLGRMGVGGCHIDL